SSAACRPYRPGQQGPAVPALTQRVPVRRQRLRREPLPGEYRGYMKPLEVMGVRVEMPTNQPIVLLRERDGDGYLPMWIGAAEATAVAYVPQGVESRRPLTHDLFVNVLTELGHEVSAVRIDRLADNVFYATPVVDGAREISARPSDAIAIA